MSQASTNTMNFSHIYIEKEALGYPDTKTILERFPSAQHINITHYKDIFNRRHQSFSAQKSSVKLILAVQKGNFLYKGSERIQNFKEDTVFYNALIRNCVYNCEYCFLQGIHKTANIVIFVNNDDFMEAAYQASRSGPCLYLSISYLSDLLAFEPLLPFNNRWIDFARQTDNILIESRTKSDNYAAIRNQRPCNRVVLVWSMTPEALSQRFEQGCASFQNRLFQVAMATRDGWRVRLVFDPVMLTDNWQRLYQECIDTIFTRLAQDSIEQVSVGGFRIHTGFLKYMRSDRPDSAFLHQKFTEAGGLASYDKEQTRVIQETIANMLERYIARTEISFVYG